MMLQLSVYRELGFSGFSFLYIHTDKDIHTFIHKPVPISNVARQKTIPVIKTLTRVSW